MVRICTRWNLRFKDAKELNKLSHILESQLATCIYSYHIRQVKMPIIFWNTEREYRAGIKYRPGTEYRPGIVEYETSPVYRWNTGPVFYQSEIEPPRFRVKEPRCERPSKRCDIYSFAFGGSTLSSPQIGNFDVSPSSFIGGG